MANNDFGDYTFTYTTGGPANSIGGILGAMDRKNKENFAPKIDPEPPSYTETKFDCPSDFEISTQQDGTGSWLLLIVCGFLIALLLYFLS